jgi:hypothetical protein
MRQCSPSVILSLFLFFFCLSLSFYPFFIGTLVVFIFFPLRSRYHGGGGGGVIFQYIDPWGGKGALVCAGDWIKLLKTANFQAKYTLQYIQTHIHSTLKRPTPHHDPNPSQFS